MTRCSGRDGAFWFLMAGGRPGPAVPHGDRRRAGAGQQLHAATSAASSSRRSGDRGGLGRPRPALRRPRLRRLAGQADDGIGRHLRSTVHPPLGYLGRAGREVAPVRLRRSSGGKLAGSGTSADRRAGRRHAVQAVRRRRGDRALARWPDRLLHAARGGADRAASRPTSTSSRCPSDGIGAAGQSDRRQ